MSLPEIVARPGLPKLKIPGIPALDPLDLYILAGLAAWTATALWGRPIGDYGVETDFYGDFVPGARRWMGGEPSAGNGFRGPLYYLLIGAGEVVTGDAFLFAKLLSVVSVAAGLRILGGLLRRLFGEPVACVAVLFVAANSVLAGHAFRACSDTVFWLLFVAALSMLFRGYGGGRVLGSASVPWLTSGFLAGAAWLTRYNGVVLLPAALGVTFFAGGPPRLALRRGGLFLLGWGIMALPWAVFLWRETGDPLWNSNYQNFAIEVFCPNPSVAQQGQFMREVGFGSFAEVLAVDPLRVAATLGRNLGTHFLANLRLLVGWPVGILAVAGYVLEIRGWKHRPRLAFLAIGVLTYLSLLPVFYNPRFMLPLLVWWGAGVGLTARFLLARVGMLPPPRPGIGWTRGTVLVLGLASAHAIWGNVREISRSLDPTRDEASPVEILRVAEEARRRGVDTNSRTPIAARKPHIGYYLDAPVIPIPFGDLSDLRESGAHFLLVSPIEANLYPSLVQLAEIPPGMRAPQGLIPVAHVRITLDDRRYRPVSLYALENPKPASPTPPSPAPTQQTLVGLDRLDTLRLRMGRWGFLWAPDEPVRPWLDQMSAPGRGHWESRLLEGDVSLREGHLDAAAELYRSVRESHPKEPRVLCRQAGILYLRGDRAGMHRLLADVDTGSSSPDDAEWLRLGGRFLDEGEAPAALAPLAACLEAAPGSYPCLESLGFALLGLERPGEALPLLREAIRIQPANQRLIELVRSLETHSAGGSDATSR